MNGKVALAVLSILLVSGCCQKINPNDIVNGCTQLGLLSKTCPEGVIQLQKMSGESPCGEGLWQVHCITLNDTEAGALKSSDSNVNMTTPSEDASGDFQPLAPLPTIEPLAPQE